MGEEINTNELRIAIDMGPDYEASPRVAAAIEELVVALAEDDGDDVVGFGGMNMANGFSLGYVTGGSDGDTGGGSVKAQLKSWSKVPDYSWIDKSSPILF